MKIKSLLCLLLFVVVCGTSAVLPTSAVQTTECEYCRRIHPKIHTSKDGNYKYILLDDIDSTEKSQYESTNNICVIEYMGNTTSNFTFASNVDGYTVTHIGEIYCSSLVGTTEKSRVPFFSYNPKNLIIPKSITSFNSISTNGGSEYTEWHFNNEYSGKKYYDDSYFPYKYVPKSITVESGNTAFKVADNALYSKDMTILYKYWGDDKVFSVPNSVKVITRYALAYSPVEEVRLPKGLKYIAPDAFYASSIKNIEIPSGVKEIMERSFKNCEKLDSIVFAEGVQYIKAYAFMNCLALKTLELPQSITSTEYNAFKNCKIEKYIAHGDYIPEDKIFETCDIYIAYRIPKKVVSLSYSPSGIKTTSLKVNWLTQGGVNGYRVYIKKSGEKKYTRVTTLKGCRKCTYTITGLKSGTKYYIKVRAYKLANGKKQFGEYSDVLTVNTKLKTPTVKLIAKKKSFSFKYSKVSGAQGFLIRYKTGNGKWKYKSYTTTKSVTVTIKKLKSGKKYEFQLRAVRKIGKVVVNSNWTDKRIIKVK